MAKVTDAKMPSDDLPDGTDKNPYLGSLTILTSLFFIWFYNLLNDILIPHLKSVFTLSYTQAMLVQFCFFTAILLFLFPAVIWLKKSITKAALLPGYQ